MAEGIEKYDMSISFSEATINVKQEPEDSYCEDDDKTTVYETIIIKSDVPAKHCIPDEFNLSSSKVNSIDTIGEINAAEDLKNEHENELELGNSHEEYQGYSTKCDMLTDVLNKHIPTIICDRAVEELPNDILEIRMSLGQYGIFALKVIPEGVRFGPFTGLSASQRSFRIKGGRFVVAEEKSKYLNWMQYINPANNISEQNMFVFQHEDNVYYRSSREIQEGEELLVYFGEEYEGSLHNNIEVNFIPYTQHGAYDVFACMLCCLGFSSRIYLVKHKTICVNESNETFVVEELTQCQTCKIYLYKKEYLESHKAHCKGKSISKCISTAFEVKNRKAQRRQIYKCSHCKYDTTYKGDLKTHVVVKHCNLKTHWCSTCRRRFKTKASLKLHMRHTKHVGKHEEHKHSTIDCSKSNIEAKVLKCSVCQYQTTNKYYLKNHIERRHFKKDNFMCEMCAYKTHCKRYLGRHIRTKHLEQFNFKCASCEYVTNNSGHFKAHTNSIHLKEFSYVCEMCGYKTNKKSNLERHTRRRHLEEYSYECADCQYHTNEKSYFDDHLRTKHLKEFNYSCDLCEYKTNKKSNLKVHTNAKHLKAFDYKCEICEFKAYMKSLLEYHIKEKHLNEFRYRCESCDYKTNQNSKLKFHIKSKHLKEFSFKCDSCEYETNNNGHLKSHVETKHLKEFSYVCESCGYKTNRKSNLDRHTRTIHLQKFTYECVDCEYQTNEKQYYEGHVKSKHLKEFNYKCESCDYKTNKRSRLDVHTKGKHLKEYNYICEVCGYKTNQKSHLEMHAKSKHLKEFRFNCSACEYKTNYKASLESHVKRRHPNNLE